MFRKKKDEKDGEPRRPRGPFDEFDDFFMDFDKMDEMMNDIMKSMFSSLGDMQRGKPFVYGFSMKTGPDGKPVINEFGNVKPGKKAVVSDAREPLVDVMERDKDIMVIAELPGVSKGDIDLEFEGGALVISVEHPKKYYKVVELPVKVVEDKIGATYNNGVLEIKLKRKSERKNKGKKITIR
jgi:HSP20 family protein